MNEFSWLVSALTWLLILTSLVTFMNYMLTFKASFSLNKAASFGFEKLI